MNASIGFAALTLNPLFCGKLCLTLAHSLWQMALLTVLVAVVSHFWKRRNVESSYAAHVVALLLGLAAIPITFAMIDLAGPMMSPVQLSVRNESLPADTRLEPMPVVTAPPVVTLPVSVPDLRPKENLRQPRVGWWLDFAPWLLTGYAVGVAVMILRLALAFWKSYQLASRAAPITSGPLFELLQTLARKWSVWVVPTLAQAEQIVVPQVVGLLQPTILLPASAITGLTVSELEMILAHELAHVRRYDMWIHLVQRLAEAVLFFNPALWLLSRRISILREYCCDAQTCRIASQEPVAVRLHYAQTLLRIVELNERKYPRAELTALASTGRRPSELRRRVARLFGEPLREPVRISRGGMISLFAGFALLMTGPLTWQTAAEHIEEPPKESQDSEDNATTASEFSFGTKVEVLGIGTYDEEPTRWWDKNGELLQNVSFKVQGAGVSAEAEHIARQLVFQIKGLPMDAHVIWNVLGCVGAGGGEVVLNGEASPPGYYSIVFSTPAKSKSVGLRVGVAVGEWKTVAQSIFPQSNSLLLPDGNTIASSGVLAETISAIPAPAMPGGNREIATVITHTYGDQNVQVLAVDTNGRKYKSGRYSIHAVGESVRQTKCTYRNLKPEQIDHFEFQTRDYEWVEIKDLPLEPGEKIAGDAQDSRL